MFLEASFIAKKFPPVAYLLIMAESLQVAGLNIDGHLAARMVGAISGGAVTWLLRADVAISRRVACLLLGICGGISFSPIAGWALEKYMEGSPLLTYGCAFVCSLGCVRMLEAWADNPLSFLRKLVDFRRTLNKRDTKDEPEPEKE